MIENPISQNAYHDYGEPHVIDSDQRKKPPWKHPPKLDSQSPVISKKTRVPKAIFEKILGFSRAHTKPKPFIKVESKKDLDKNSSQKAIHDEIQEKVSTKRRLFFCDMFTPRDILKKLTSDYDTKKSARNDAGPISINLKTPDTRTNQEYTHTSDIQNTPLANRSTSHFESHYTPEKLTLNKDKSLTEFNIPTFTGFKTVQFSWLIARSLIKLQMQPAELFSLYEVPWSLWKLHQIPTLGASSSSCRVQKMFKGIIPISTKNGKQPRVFVKAIPMSMWKKQWENQNKWLGNYVTDGENFVMEAAALAFLQQYAPNLTPRLYGILELHSSTITKNETSRKTFHYNLNNQQKTLAPLKQASRHGREGLKEPSYIVIVSELYGEDLLDFFERREREQQPLTVMEKTALQYDCLSLLKCLHNVGLAHLDFTPENILFGPQGLRLCDFAKATPLYTTHPRHIMSKEFAPSQNRSYVFESCEPTVGKGAYMPPECWKIYWELEDKRIQYPLTDLSDLKTPLERSIYYFRVDTADVYMAGVFLFWLWSEGGIWKCSDEKQDKKFQQLVNSEINFNLFRECKNWPISLKKLLKMALNPNPQYRATLSKLMESEWFDQIRYS